MPQGICRDLDRIEPDRALAPGASVRARARVCVCVCVCVMDRGWGRLLRARVRFSGSSLGLLILYPASELLSMVLVWGWGGVIGR